MSKIKPKDLHVMLIKAKPAHAFVRKHHYSGKSVNNSQLHFGVFANGILGGVLQYGPPMDKRKLINLVQDTQWSEFLELNRMVFADWLPRNSESRCIGYTLRWIKKNYPHMKWVVSFADATQCGDGTIYRAAGFHLTNINKNKTLIRLPNGSIAANITYSKGKYILNGKGKAAVPEGSEPLQGYQLRYIKLLDPALENKLNCKILPYSAIQAQGAAMYRGERSAGV